MGQIKRSDIPFIATEFQLANKAAITRTRRNGTVVRELAVATFDTATNDSGGTSNKTTAAHPLGVYLPTKAIVTNAWYDVITTFTDGASDTATIALSVEGAGDLKAAISVA